MASNGYILIHRELFDHDVFAPEPYTEREAWMWLIKEAAWKAGSVRTKAGPRKVQRGELISSTRFMADRWGWQAPRVRRFLRRLISASMICSKTDPVATHITICNYNHYQDLRSRIDPETTQRRPSSDPNNKERNTINEVNSYTAREENFDYPIDAFERWFEKYPHKVGIQAARKEFGFVRSYGKVSFKTLLDGVERYVASKPDDREWCNPARWLKEGRWDDVPGPPAKKGNGKIGFGETAEMMINDLRAKERTIAEIGGDADEQFALSAPKRI